MTLTTNKVILALGSNLGDREKNLARAAQEIAVLGKVKKVSSFIETEPEGFKEQPRFLNGAVLLETELPPDLLLDRLQRIEADMGRRRSFKNAPREIDIDIIFYNTLIFKGARLTLPHPRAHLRGFVLRPAAEIAPDFLHPVLQKTVKELSEKL